MLGSQILVAAAELGAGGIVGIAVATLVVGLVAEPKTSERTRC